MVLSLSHCYGNDRFTALPTLIHVEESSKEAYVVPFGGFLWVAFTASSHCYAFSHLPFYFSLLLWKVTLFISRFWDSTQFYTCIHKTCIGYLGTIKRGRLLVQKWIELVLALSGLLVQWTWVDCVLTVSVQLPMLQID